MPIRSTAQQGWIFAHFPRTKALEWAHETKNLKKLPEHVHHAKRASAFIDGFADELLTKTAVSSSLVQSAVRQALERDPNRVGRFIGHLRALGGPRASSARAVAVREARGFIGWGVRSGNPNRAVSGTIVDGAKIAGA